MEIIIGQLLPYLSVGVFLAGTCMRIAKWVRTPVPFHLTLFPVPEGIMGRVGAVASEFFFCKTLYRHDKRLWLMTWFFHLSLAMVLAGHLLGIYFLRCQFYFVGLSVVSSCMMSRILGGAAGIIMAASLGGLLCRRIFLPVVRKLSEPENFVSLILLSAVALSGMLMYLPGYHVDLLAVRSYTGALVRFSPIPLPRNSLFVIHFALVNFFLLCFPFSRMLHSVGFFVIRTMLVEAPPVYPTPTNACPRSEFATKRISPDIPVPKKSAAVGRGGDAG
jgi:nitrate reductase gamma subunit